MGLELNNIYNMDCVEGMKQLDDESIDLVVTSPPYNLDIKYDTYMDNRPIEEYLEWCNEWIHEIARVLKPDGRVCINHCLSQYPVLESDKVKWGKAWFPLKELGQIMKNNGLQIYNLALWDDRTMHKMTAWGSWLSASAPAMVPPFEGILIGYKDSWKKLSKGESTIDKETFMECASGLWNCGTVVGNTIACFPEKLPYMCIQFLSYKNDIVMDPFSGSGTTCYVAKSCDRRFIGFELSENYYNSSIARLADGKGYKIKPKAKEEEEQKVDKVSLW